MADFDFGPRGGKGADFFIFGRILFVPVRTNILSQVLELLLMSEKTTPDFVIRQF